MNERGDIAGVDSVVVNNDRLDNVGQMSPITTSSASSACMQNKPTHHSATVRIIPILFPTVNYV